MGETPVDITLSPGTHQLRLTLADFLAAERTVVAVNGIEEEVSVTLLAVAADGSGWQRTTGWIALGSGLAAMAGGIALLRRRRPVVRLFRRR